MKLTKTDIELAISAVATQTRVFRDEVNYLGDPDKFASEYGKFIVALAKELKQNIENKTRSSELNI